MKKHGDGKGDEQNTNRPNGNYGLVGLSTRRLWMAEFTNSRNEIDREGITVFSPQGGTVENGT